MKSSGRGGTGQAAEENQEAVESDYLSEVGEEAAETGTVVVHSIDRACV